MKKITVKNMIPLLGLTLIAGLIIWMTVEIAQGVTQAFQQMTEEKTLVVIEKHQEQSGMACSKIGPSITCNPTYTYYINEIKASKKAYNMVEVGAEYNCKLWSGRIQECQNAI